MLIYAAVGPGGTSRLQNIPKSKGRTDDARSWQAGCACLCSGTAAFPRAMAITVWQIPRVSESVTREESCFLFFCTFVRLHHNPAAAAAFLFLSIALSSRQRVWTIQDCRLERLYRYKSESYLACFWTSVS